MSNTDSVRRKAFILREVDGAERPLLVEKIYVRWDANVLNLMATNGHRRELLYRWPGPGRAWETFKDDITALINEASVVMCANTDPSDHPEHHLTCGHEGYKPFAYGPTPMVLRYLATPAGSTAWRAALDKREWLAAEAAASEAQFLESLRAAALAAIKVKPVTETALTRQLPGKRDEIRRVVRELSDAGQIAVVGRSLLGATRWAPVGLSGPVTK
jgi:hypothetical protein